MTQQDYSKNNYLWEQWQNKTISEFLNADGFVFAKVFLADQETKLVVKRAKDNRGAVIFWRNGNKTGNSISRPLATSKTMYDLFDTAKDIFHIAYREKASVEPYLEFVVSREKAAKIKQIAAEKYEMHAEIRKIILELAKNVPHYHTDFYKELQAKKTVSDKLDILFKYVDKISSNKTQKEIKHYYNFFNTDVSKWKVGDGVYFNVAGVQKVSRGWAIKEIFPESKKAEIVLVSGAIYADAKQGSKDIIYLHELKRDRNFDVDFDKFKNKSFLPLQQAKTLLSQYKKDSGLV